MTDDSHAPDDPTPALRWEPLNPGWLARGREYDYLIHRDNLTGRLVLARCRLASAQPGNEMAMVREIMSTTVEMYEPGPAKRLAEDFEAGRTCVLGEEIFSEAGYSTPAAWRQPRPRRDKKFLIADEDVSFPAGRRQAQRDAGRKTCPCGNAWADEPGHGDDPGHGEGLQGRDAEGYLVYLTRDDMDTRVTECCHASAKGTEDGICCRKCYALIDDAIGGQPVPPYTLDGRVTFAGPKARGWGEDPPGPPYAFKFTVGQLEGTS
jgi:hypothetical protein